MAHRWLTVNCKIIYGVLFYLSFLLCTTIRPKIKVLFDLFLLFLHDHLTKIRGHSNSLFFFLIVPRFCSLALFMAILLLYFVGYIYGYMKPFPGIQTERKANLGWWKIRSNEKHRICILSRDLNYARCNLWGFVKDGIDYSEITQMFLLSFIFMCLE